MVAPPQSTSVSPPFWTPSFGVGVAQVLPEQMWLVQSCLPLHIFPGAHGGASSAPRFPAPPQSTSVSPPFCTPSFEDGGWHVHVSPSGQSSGRPPAPALSLQTPVKQSLPSVHPCPTWHTGAPSLEGFFVPLSSMKPPPQSTSVSLSFFTPSLAVGDWQTPPVHTSLWQSVASAQPLFEPQAGAPSDAGFFIPFARTAPPQSTSVSLSFFTPS